MTKSRLFPLLLAATLLLATGCAAFNAKPSTFTLEGTSWKVSSAELASELGFPPIKPASASEVLLIVKSEVQGEPVSSSNGESVRAAFGKIILKDSGKKPDQAFPNSKEQGGPIVSVWCVFSVPKETASVELVLPNSQTIAIALKR